jgi:Xaa-Pro aminopeptidase
MVTDWKAPNTKLPKPVAGFESYERRRRALSQKFPGETLVIPTGHEKVRANDTNYPFRAGTDFYYLTGNTEPDCVLVLEPTADGHRDVLYVEPNPGKTDKTFFTDRVKGELWVGPRLGVPQSKARFAVDECRALADLTTSLSACTTPIRLLRGSSPSLEASTGQTTEDRDRELAEFLSEARLLKDPLEIKELSRAIASTHRGFEDVIARLPGALSERELEGAFWLRARVEGNDVGYGTIAACGEHACTLHWTRNDGRVTPGELLLLDAGVEATSLYTADVTRTLPISGTFSPAQREVYDVVLEAQRQAFAMVKPGNDFLEPNRVAMRVMTEWLVSRKILRCSVEEALDERNQFFRRYTLHNVSHMLGLDVHDCARARNETYRFGKLVAGMALTVEPGLYFQPDDLTVPARFRGIGIRIEDDLVVTTKGHRILSNDIPRETDDIEAWMKQVWKATRKLRAR